MNFFVESRTIMREYICILAITCLVSGFSATCIAAPGDDRFFLLREGDECISDYTVKTTDGYVSVKRPMRQKVEGAQNVAGKIYFRVRSTWDGAMKMLNHVDWLRRDGSGVYVLRETEAGRVEQPLIKFPLIAGKSWASRAADGTPESTTIIGVESITINDRHYDECIHFCTVRESVTEDFWEAPGIGTVKSVDRFKDGSEMTILLREKRGGIGDEKH